MDARPGELVRQLHRGARTFPRSHKAGGPDKRRHSSGQPGSARRTVQAPWRHTPARNHFRTATPTSLQGSHRQCRSCRCPSSRPSPPGPPRVSTGAPSPGAHANRGRVPPNWQCSTSRSTSPCAGWDKPPDPPTRHESDPLLSPTFPRAHDMLLSGAAGARTRPSGRCPKERPSHHRCRSHLHYMQHTRCAQIHLGLKGSTSSA